MTRSADVPRGYRRRHLENAVAAWIGENVLTEDVIADVITELRRRLAAPKSVDVTHLEQRVRSLRTEVDRLVLALATSDEKPQAIVSAISERQAQLNELTGTIAATQAAPKAIGTELSRLEADARGRLVVLREALAASPTKARDVMKALFEGPLKVHHEEGVGAVVTGTAVLGPIFVTASPNVASPTGFEPVLAA